MTEEKPPSESEFLLIEQSLRGELSEEGVLALQKALEAYPELRRFYDDAVKQQALLSQQDQRGAEDVDWTKPGRGARLLAWRYTFGLLVHIALTLWFFWLIFETEGFGRALFISVAIIFGLKIIDRWQDRRRFENQMRDLPDTKDEFLRSYRKLLKKEWKRWRGDWFGWVIGGLFLTLLGLIGNKPVPCFVVAGGCFLAAFYQHHFVAKPLHRELKALKKS